MRTLLAVDGSACSDRATRYVIALAADRPGETVHVLNVQAPADSWAVRRLMKPEEVEAMQESRGGDALASARALLDAAGVAYTPVVAIGPVAPTIARYARDHACDRIVIGTRGETALESVLMGSTATDVVHHAGVPVTLVK